MKKEHGEAKAETAAKTPPPLGLVWEQLGSVSGKAVLSRARIPGGWLVCVGTDSEHPAAVTYDLGYRSEQGNFMLIQRMRKGTTGHNLRLLGEA